MIIKGRDIKAPFVSIGLDGGKQKVTLYSQLTRVIIINIIFQVLVTMHLYDDEEPDKDPLFKDGGWRRAIILARADYCKEVILIFSYLKHLDQQIISRPGKMLR